MDTMSNVYTDQILRRVTKTMNEVLSVPSDKITLSARLMEDLGADSLDAVEVVMALEDEFQTHFGDVDRDKIVTVEDVVNYVTRQLVKPAQPTANEVA